MDRLPVARGSRSRQCRRHERLTPGNGSAGNAVRRQADVLGRVQGPSCIVRTTAQDGVGSRRRFFPTGRFAPEAVVLFESAFEPGATWALCLETQAERLQVARSYRLNRASDGEFCTTATPARSGVASPSVMSSDIICCTGRSFPTA